MKKLKLEHALAEQVLRGEKRTTWRMFDDKDLSVNNDVELIDKVDPNNPESWRRIGVGHINKVIEKRLGEIEAADMDSYHKYASQAEMLHAFQGYYGSNVTLNTPLKLIYFDFALSDPSENGTTRNVEEIKAFADGGSRGNPGPSASGYVLTDVRDKVLVDKGVYLGITTNNQAEYQALKLALEEAQRMCARRVAVYMDSLLVINQMNGVFKVSNRDLWPIHDTCKRLVTGFERVSFTHVPRELNQAADAAVNRALDGAIHASKVMP